MAAATLIFPHQLFPNHPSIKKGQVVYLVEEWLFFRQYNFHQQKLVLHRASMQQFKNYLIQQKINVAYVDCIHSLSDVRKLIAQLAKEKITEIHFADVADDWLKKRIENSCRKSGIQMIESATPNFINTPEEANLFFDKKKKYFQTAFLH